MAIRVGTGDNLKRIYLGNGNIQEVYLGETLIWSENLSPSIDVDGDTSLSIAASRAYTINFTITEQDEEDSIASVTMTGPAGFTPPTFNVPANAKTFSSSFTIPATLFTTGGTPTDNEFVITAEDSMGGTSTETITITNVNRADYVSGISTYPLNGSAQTMVITNAGADALLIEAPSWITIGTYNNSSTSIALTASSRAGTCGNRSGTIFIRKGTGAAEYVDSLSVTQTGESSSVNLSPSSRTKDSSAGSVTYTVSSSGFGSLSCNDNRSWASTSVSGSTVTVTLQALTGFSNRSGTVTCSRGCASDSSSFTQTALVQTISISDNTNANAIGSPAVTQHSVTQNGPSTPVFSNVPSFASPRSLSPTQTAFFVDYTNNTGCQRTGTVTVTKGNGSDTFQVGQQKASAVLNASTNTWNTGPASATLNSTLTHSGCGNLVVTSNQSWLTCLTNGGASVAQNTGAARTGVCTRQKINTVDNGVEITRLRTVNQSSGAASITSITPNEDEPQAGGNVTYSSVVSAPLSQTVTYNWSVSGSGCSTVGATNGTSVVVTNSGTGNCVTTLSITDQYSNTDSESDTLNWASANSFTSCTINPSTLVVGSVRPGLPPANYIRFQGSVTVNGITGGVFGSSSNTIAYSAYLSNCGSGVTILSSANSPFNVSGTFNNLFASSLVSHTLPQSGVMRLGTTTPAGIGQTCTMTLIASAASGSNYEGSVTCSKTLTITS